MSNRSWAPGGQRVLLSVLTALVLSTVGVAQTPWPASPAWPTPTQPGPAPAPPVPTGSGLPGMSIGTPMPLPAGMPPKEYQIGGSLAPNSMPLPNQNYPMGLNSSTQAGFPGTMPSPTMTNPTMANQSGAMLPVSNIVPGPPPGLVTTGTADYAAPVIDSSHIAPPALPVPATVHTAPNPALPISQTLLTEPSHAVTPTVFGSLPATETALIPPNMLGDFIGAIYVGPQPPPPVPPVGGVAARGTQDLAIQRTITRYKIGEFNSPIPQNRLIMRYNYYNNPFDTTGDLHRIIPGVELAFMNQLFSFELRGSINSFVNYPDINNVTEPGDLQLILKVAPWRGPDGAISGGLGVGFPVGDQVAGVPDDNYYFSPFLAYYYSPENWPIYVIGFHQIDIPTAEEDQGLLQTDVGFGYWLWRNRQQPLTALAVVGELHLYTPYGDDPDGSLAFLNYDDVLNATFGINSFFWNRGTIGIGVAVPLTDEQDYDVEAMLHADWRF